MSDEMRVGPTSDLPEGAVTGCGSWAVGNAKGDVFAVSRKCRHLGADLAGGSVDGKGQLVCPRHGARYDVATGHMVRGPQGIFAKVPGLEWAFKMLTKVVPLRRGTIVERDGDLFVK